MANTLKPFDFFSVTIRCREVRSDGQVADIEHYRLFLLTAENSNFPINNERILFTIIYSFFDKCENASHIAENVNRVYGPDNVTVIPVILM